MNRRLKRTSRPREGYCTGLPHSACEMVPLASSEDLDQLRASMKTRGFDPRFPIVTDELGFILDGRHRWQIATELDIRPVIVRWKPVNEQDTPARFVLAANARRNLTAAQRVALAAALLPEIEREAAERQKAGMSADGKAGGRGNKRENPTGTLPVRFSRHDRTSTARAAKAAGVSEKAVRVAKAVQAKSPQTFAKMRAGEITVAEAKRAIENDPPPAADDEILDELETVVTDPRAREAFGQLTRLQNLENAIARVIRDAREVAGLAAGSRLQRLEPALHQAKVMVRSGRPHAVCPERACGPQCRTCHGAGWLTADEFKSWRAAHRNAG